MKLKNGEVQSICSIISKMLKASGIQSLIGMHRIAIFIIRPEPDSTGYQINYPAGTGTGTGYWRIHGYLLHDSQFFVCLHYSVL